MMMMMSWIYMTLITVVVIVLILILMRKKCSRPITPADTESSHKQNNDAVSDQAQNLNKQNNDAVSDQDQNLNPQTSYHVSGQRKPFFSWSDHPSLAAEAVENGWPRFAFASDHGNKSNVEMSWEVFDESTDHMQKIRLNSEATTSLCVIRAALPLPGPQFAHTSFPVEAYFEIRILPNHHQDFESDLNEGRSGDSKIEQVKLGGKKDEIVLLAIGLTGGTSPLPLKNPGSFLGSVGFNSTASVYLDGKKLVGESEKEEWGRAGNVIGCGYNPSEKKVLFTVNSQLVYEIRCKTEEFGYPLYPTLAANSEVTVVVNLGQSPFQFEAANSHRTHNPCFISSNGTAPFYELDSKELFSMGRIDLKWKHSAARTSGEYDDHMSEGDLFEIVAR